MIFADGQATVGARYRPELNGIQIIHAEITAVTTTMLKNQRWRVDSEERSSRNVHKYLKGMDKVVKYLVNATNNENHFDSSFALPSVEAY
jgi:hypothetical protein